ncbi:Diacylglycerol acyltransferase family-containing protein [Strongyloides ratti]|uniref:Diacylglycerol acyltransferase family-containing protein n=1 Tax=Strongyloides ratti TaxID=34506 RepID=A0A090MS06_STRRB|nr:Diacylglycerol acyltransferase family-containing protein [Strongyloides ratti]CEF61038.1 Diacylglycerol acyltransferase family-containing protein [Strongyloides ratti]
MPLYLIWYIYDFNTPRNGSRVSYNFRNSRIWKYLADYFPIKLIKTSELNPEKNYIIGCHPHGILSIGSFVTLCTNGTNFMTMFPGIKSYLMTLHAQFFLPFRREIGIALGGIEASPTSLKYLLTKCGKGNVVGIVLGGVHELYDAHPKTNVLKIGNRRGFCKYALKYGADIVPMYNFGENDVYEQIPNERTSFIRQIQMKICHKFGFIPPIIRGRGIFNYSFGMLPHQNPIYCVMGKPIEVIQNDTPTEAEIEELYQKYIDCLKKLFNNYKCAYGLSEDAVLDIY